MERGLRAVCGIIGVAGPAAASLRESLARLRDTMTHRGPDAEGVWWSACGTVGLAHRRLSVIDLSPLAAQPMSDPAGHVHLVFNGEIYNYRELRRTLERGGQCFRSLSDTEVLLAAYREWGEACVQHLDGMFAFGLYDARTQRILLARDRAGEKPLYYRLDAQGLLFASELTPFLETSTPRRLDLEALQHYLAYGYPPSDRSLLEGVSRLPPAHVLWFDLRSGAQGIRRYWDLPEPVPAVLPDADRLEEELEALVVASVRRCLNADVPLGVLLSGGIDSSVVAALAAREHAPGLRTFTLTFPGHPHHDESRYARRVAEHIGSEHTELPADEASVELLPRIAGALDEPLGDSSIIPTFLVAGLTRAHVTVALGGDGADELFGGYWQHTYIRRYDAFRHLVPGPARELVAALGRRLPVGSRGRNQLIGLGGPLGRSIAHVDLFFDSRSRKAILSRGLRDRLRATVPEEDRAAAVEGRATPLQGMMRSDFSNYLPNDVLAKVDRASMLHSLEVRSPFLGKDVVSFAFGRVPDGLKVDRRGRKILLRRLAARLLPRDLDLRRKQGFSIPLRAWLDGSYGRTFRDTLQGVDPNLFDRRAVLSLLGQHGRGVDNGKRLFLLTMLELWRRARNVRLPA